MHNIRHNRKTVIIRQTIIVPAKSIIVASLTAIQIIGEQWIVGPGDRLSNSKK